MSYIKKYRNKAHINGNTYRERIIYEERKAFEHYLRNAPNSHLILRKSIYYDDKEIDCTIQDSVFNDFRANDSKVVCVKHNEEMVVGDTFNWKDRTLLCIYEEENGIQSHRTFVFKFCNNVITLKDNSGNLIKLPCILTDATLYSDGLYRGEHFSMNNDKRSLVVAYNKYTKNIKAFDRLLFNSDSAYKVSKIDNFSSKYLGCEYGVLQFMLIRENIIPEDDIENNLAYNPIGSADSDTVVSELEVLGNHKIIINEVAEYRIDADCIGVKLLNGEYADIIDRTSNKITIKAKKVGFAILEFDLGLEKIIKNVMITK